MEVSSRAASSFGLHSIICRRRYNIRIGPTASKPPTDDQHRDEPQALTIYSRRKKQPEAALPIGSLH
ncbi:MAG: hypothetical protein R3C11_25100 [Planctomycetaceae bacterium]